MRSSTDILSESFDDLDDLEFIESVAAKQSRFMKSVIKSSYSTKKESIRNKRREKEKLKTKAFVVDRT